MCMSSDYRCTENLKQSYRKSKITTLLSSELCLKSIQIPSEKFLSNVAVKHENWFFFPLKASDVFSSYLLQM